MHLCIDIDIFCCQIYDMLSLSSWLTIVRLVDLFENTNKCILTYGFAAQLLVCITFNGSFVELHDTDMVKQNLTFLLF